MDKAEKEEFRRVDTGMYTDVAAAIADELRDRVRLQCLVYAGRDKDGQVYFLVRTRKTRFPGSSKDVPNPFFGRSDAEVLSAIADELKSDVEMTAYDRSWEDGWWSRKSARKWMTSRSTIYRDAVRITVADAFKAYRVLKGDSRRPDSRVVGRPLTPADLRRLEKNRAREKAKAVAKHEKELAEWRKTRLIHTNMYGDRAYELLSLLCGHYYFKLLPKTMRELETFVKVRRAEDKEVCLDVRRRKFSLEARPRRNPFFGKTDAQAAAWLGNAVKAFAVRHAESGRKGGLEKGWWSASNCETLFGPADYSWLSADGISVSDAYVAAAALKGARLEDAVGQVVGRPLTPEEMREIRDVKVREDAKAEIRRRYLDAVCEMRLGFAKKAADGADRLRKKFEKEIHAVDPGADLEKPDQRFFSPVCLLGRACAVESV